MSQQALFEEIEVVFGDSPAREICISLANAILQLDHQSARHLTFQTLLTLLGESELDAETFTAINLLVSAQNAILSAHGIYVDDEGEEFILNDDEFQYLISNGELLHPDTGELVENPMSFVAPYFSRVESQAHKLAS